MHTAKSFWLRCPDKVRRECWWNHDKRPGEFKYVYTTVNGVRVDGVIVSNRFYPDPPNQHLVHTVEQKLRRVHGW